MTALQLSAFQKANSIKKFVQLLSSALNDIKLIIAVKHDTNSNMLDFIEDEHAIIEVASIEDRQELQAFLEKNGKNLFIKFKELMDQLYKESELPYQEKIDLLLNTKEELEFLKLTFSPDSKYYFIPNVKFYVDNKDSNTAKWISLDRLKLTDEQRTIVENILGVCYEFCLGLNKLMDLGLYRIRLNTHQFNTYTLNPKEGAMLLGEFVLALTYPKNAFLKLDSLQTNQLYKNLLHLFGIPFHPKKPFSAVRHYILDKKKPGIELERLLESLNSIKGHPRTKKSKKEQ